MVQKGYSFKGAALKKNVQKSGKCPQKNGGPGLGSNSSNSNSIHTNNVSAAGSLGVGGQVITNNFVTESQVLDKKR